MQSSETQPSKMAENEKSANFMGVRGNNAEFKKLCRAPAVAWPTILLFFFAAGGYLVFALGAFTESLPISYELTGVVCGFFAYLQFSVGHDSSHRAISTNTKVNDLFGNMALWFLAPFATMSVIRRIHMQHHVYANGEKDPDHWIHHGSLLTLPFRWATLECYYAYYYLRYQQPRPFKEVATVVVALILVISMIASLISAGYGEEVLWLWFVPTRIGVFLVSMVFVFLPHYPHEVAQNEDPYAATTIRKGWEWLLTPLLAYQNYHLVHHLYPTAPFYNNIKIWEIKSKEKAFLEKKPAIVSAFGLKHTR